MVISVAFAAVISERLEFDISVEAQLMNTNIDNNFLIDKVE